MPDPTRTTIIISYKKDSTPATKTLFPFLHFRCKTKFHPLLLNAG
jgi:hypothetical protein